MTEADRENCELNNKAAVIYGIAAIIIASTLIIAVTIQSTTAAHTPSHAIKRNIYPTVDTPDLKIPIVILTNSEGEQTYLRLVEYADGKGNGISYSNFIEPTEPEITLRAGEVFRLEFTNGQVPITHITGETDTLEQPIAIRWEPGPGSDAIIDAVQIRPESSTEARFFLDTHVSAEDDESMPAQGEEQLFLTINYPDTVNGYPLWINYMALVNVEPSETADDDIPLA